MRIEVREAADALADLVVKNGYHLNTGFLSTPDLCRVLAENGHADTAYRLLLQEECPSWLYAVKKGATTIWETWDGVRDDGTVHDSLNHYSYGAITGWLFDGVCGISLKAGKEAHAAADPEPEPRLCQGRVALPGRRDQERLGLSERQDRFRLHRARPGDGHTARREKL